jgi:hypothetical protein
MVQEIMRHHTSVCVCVCVCACVRERERERVCLCMCIYNYFKSNVNNYYNDITLGITEPRLAHRLVS